MLRRSNLALILGFVSASALAQAPSINGGMTPNASNAILPDAVIKLGLKTPSAVVGNSIFVLPDNIIDDTTSNSLNSRKLNYAPTASAITDIVLALPGFGLNDPEADFPTTYTASLSVEYPIGTTPVRVYFGGAASVTVPPGRVLVKSDPLPIRIPAGAQFAVKSYVTWPVGHFWLGTWVASLMTGEWTTRGTNVVDNTLNTSTLSTTTNVAGFAPITFATLATPLPVLGMIGDSLGTVTGDQPDTSVGFNFWGRAMRGKIPFVNLSRGGDSMSNYVTRPEGRNLVLRDSITHVIIEGGGNDLYGGASAATIEAQLQTIINPFLARGIKVWGMTLSPRTTSTDAWITAANQTLVSAPIEAVRQTYNTWLRANYVSIGMQGIFDVAHVIDPTDSGKWSFDAGAGTGNLASGFATLSGGTVASIAPQTYNAGGTSNGSGYPNTSSVSAVVYNYPGTPGSGATAHAVINGSGQATTYVVDTPGSGYTYPPMVAPKSAWTSDGIHPTPRGIDEIIKITGLAPELFQ